jgi:hypothetical protein
VNADVIVVVIMSTVTVTTLSLSFLQSIIIMYNDNHTVGLDQNVMFDSDSQF